jgi:hypothetical protein
MLEEARERGVLRTVGSVYQCRHATIQDRPAATAARSGARHEHLTGSEQDPMKAVQEPGE